MKIGIDARHFGNKDKGIGRHTQALILQLEKLPSEHDFFVFLNKKGFSEYQPQNNRFKKILVDIRPYSLAEQILFPQIIKKSNIDLMHFYHWNVPLIYAKPYIVTIHDLILDATPELRKKSTTLNPLLFAIKLAGYKLNTRITLKKALKIITLSHNSEKDIVHYYGISREKIKIIPNGVTNLSQQQMSRVLDDKTLLSRYNISKPFLLYVGAAYPHKNIERAISAFQQVANQKDIQFVCVGENDFFFQRLKYQVFLMGMNNRVIFPGFVPDNDLVDLYTLASAFVFPSLYEGFGLTPLESMALGTPVISSNASCLPEILEDSALFFNPNDIESIKNAMLEIMSNNTMRQHLINKGYQQIKKYTWDNSAKKLLATYDEVLTSIN